MNETTLTALQAFPDQLEALYRAFPPASTNWAPASWDGVPSEALTALQQICHVRDVEIDGYQVRFRRTRDESNPFLPSLDTDGLVIERDYARQDATVVLAEFRQARLETIQWLQTLSDEAWDRPAHFEGYGSVTLRALVYFLSSHDQQHLSGLQWLMGKLASRSVERAV